MAFTDKEQQRVLKYLGWAGLTVVADSTHYNSVVNDRLGNNVLKPLTLDIEKEVRAILTRLIAIDTSLDEAICRLSAKQVDSVTTNPRELGQLRSERRKWSKEMSEILDIPMMKSSGATIKVLS
jgi:hypothetical protein